MSDKLLDLQDQVRAELLGKAFFAAMEIISERPHTIADKVAKTVAKLSGLSITIVTMEGDQDDEGLEGARMSVFVDVHVSEKTNINRGASGSGIFATQVVEKLLEHLHGW